ncbi:DUF4115 domain-containing protein [Neisseriaceae bacterium ESL0693]|nr:DUF4115 domain-containing protein [Neisseriaceae bacterium ESL0693]
MNNQNHTLDLEPNTPLSLGNLLKQTRLQKGLSVGEVAERLKLPARQIEALENGCYQNLPEEVFIKGFITTYARLLELNAEDIQKYLQQIFPVHKSKQIYVTDQTKSTDKDLKFNYRHCKTIPKWVLGVIAVAVLGGVIYAWQGKSSAESARQAATASQEVSAQASSAAVIAASNVRVVPMTASDLAVGESASAAVSPVSSSGVHADDKGKTLVAEMPSQPLSAGNKVNSQIQTKDQLTITMDHASWLQVSDKNGVTLLSKLVEAGFKQQFEQGAPYRIIIGYTPGAHIEFNGKDVAIPQSNKKTAVLTVDGH